MTKEHILSEIRRTAATNGGKPLGVERFLKETGVKPSDWQAKYWIRWGEALREAGFQPNQLQAARTRNDLLGNLPTSCGSWAGSAGNKHSHVSCRSFAVKEAKMISLRYAPPQPKTGLGIQSQPRANRTASNMGLCTF